MGRDETQAEALRIAERYLLKMGWRFNPSQIGTVAKQIIEALDGKDPTP